MSATAADAVELTRDQKVAEIEKAIGCSREQAIIALARARNNLEAALTLLTQGVLTIEDDAEFDLIAAESPGPKVHPANPNLKKGSDAAGASKTGADLLEEAAEEDDSRITSLKEMGFTFAEATKALDDCHGDVNEALTLLLSTQA
jgi:hypothetical protein